MLLSMEYDDINEKITNKSKCEIQHDSYNMISLKHLIWTLRMKGIILKYYGLKPQRKNQVIVTE